ncbi:MAG: HD domain-containing protein [Polynucleobacter sp.]|nr:HD domain-containing protein [Polynucleobacter sp.]
MDYQRPELITYIRENFKLDWHGTHGANHWARVLHHSKVIGEHRGADLLVVELFGFLHDSCRENEYQDPGHGKRAAELARELNQTYFDLKPTQMQNLCYAIEHHSGGEVSVDATIQTCWDGDRLDLGRVGIVPSAKYLSPQATQLIDLAVVMSMKKTTL